MHIAKHQGDKCQFQNTGLTEQKHADLVCNTVKSFHFWDEISSKDKNTWFVWSDTYAFCISVLSLKTFKKADDYCIFWDHPLLQVYMSVRSVRLE